VTSYGTHWVTRVELREILILPDGTPVRRICITDRDGNCHDITLFANGTDADALRFDIEKVADREGWKETTQ
jgi:hypothetical protein